MALEPDNAFYKAQLAGAYAHRGWTLAGLDRNDEAADSALTGLAMYEELYSDDPSSIEHLSFAGHYGLLAWIAQQRGDTEAMGQYVGRQLELATQYTHMAPEDPLAWNLLFGAHNGLMELAFLEGREDDGREHAREAFEIGERFVGTPQESDGLLLGYARLLLHPRIGDLRDPSKAVQIAERLVEMTNGARPDTLLTLGTAYQASGHTELALDTLERAHSLLPRVDSALRRAIEQAIAECSAPATAPASDPDRP